MTAETAFGFDVRQLDPHVVAVEYKGHMPEDVGHLARTEAVVRGLAPPVGMLYVVPDFTSFHRSQVQQHANMISRLKDVVTGIAVIKPRPAVRFGAITVGLVSKTPLKTFETREEGLAWLKTLAG